MNAADSLGIGSALAATVAIAYTLCAFVFWWWPDAAVTFLNALFHGLDFSKLQGGPVSFSVGAFSYALFVVAVWAFVVGAIFGAMRSLFAGRRA